ncbi:hypothetical protein [Lacimonas salitolerans]|uniref:Uncharacterized protein n=1 Tax=Lacimonas salitolerans TaxID=1323750 RepID=A0ABW4EKI3_9RHOB
MIEVFLRPDLKLGLLRFSGNVSVPEIRDVITATMINTDDPPFGFTAIVDTRDTISYEASFACVLSLAEFLRAIFAPGGYHLDIVMLTDTHWKFGMAHMFAMAASSVGGIDVRLFRTEEAIMAVCGAKGDTFQGLFRPEQLYYRCSLCGNPAANAPGQGGQASSRR